MGQFEPVTKTVILPRFKLEDQLSLNDALKQLGMGLAFDENQANFSQLTPTQVYIGEVLHKTFMELNEEGTEAAAVTSVGMIQTTSVNPGPSDPPLVFDRPFLFAIRDERSGSLLFLGSLVDPEA